ncbi:MAG: hypothetical protein HYS07_05815 [Chlamydiae bacterium]|nr:hypothetical protein [Chlamydiota bacterium]MBI3277890.1 hypothetical protein [Chlamydiota bacterium]
MKSLDQSDGKSHSEKINSKFHGSVPFVKHEKSHVEWETRQLIYIPILHTQHDMGSLEPQAKSAFVDKLGERLWKHHVKSIDEMWSGIEYRLGKLKLPFKKTYLYQDGLPLCGREETIVLELAKKGSPNHKILKALMDRGSTIIGTEDPQLLVKEYNYIKQILNESDHAQKKKYIQEYEKEAPDLLKKRDRFISDQIQKTLPVDGSVGLIFIGLLHRVDEMLPSDIRVNYLIYRLPLRRSFEKELVS